MYTSSKRTKVEDLTTHKESLEQHVIESITKGFEIVDKLRQAREFGAVRKECKKIIRLMRWFPQAKQYESIWASLERLSEGGNTEEITILFYDFLCKFYQSIFKRRIERDLVTKKSRARKIGRL